MLPESDNNKKHEITGLTQVWHLNQNWNLYFTEIRVYITKCADVRQTFNNFSLHCLQTQSGATDSNFLYAHAYPKQKLSINEKDISPFFLNQTEWCLLIGFGSIEVQTVKQCVFVSFVFRLPTVFPYSRLCGDLNFVEQDLAKNSAISPSQNRIIIALINSYYKEPRYTRRLHTEMSIKSLDYITVDCIN